MGNHLFKALLFRPLDLFFADHFGDLAQALDHPGVDAAFAELALVVLFTGVLAHQQAQRLVGLADRIDMEHAVLHRLQHALVEHQRGNVGARDDHPLLAGQAAGLAEAEEAFDLLVDPAHRLHFAKLVDGAGDGEALLERCTRQGGNQRAGLTQRGTVTVHVAVGLFQGNARRNRQGEFLGIAAAQVTGEDHHALGVDRLAQVDLALDVDDAAAARVDSGGNARRHAERRVADLQHGEPVALADRRALAVDQDDAGEHVVEHPLRDTTGTRGLGLQRTLDVPGVGHLVTGQLADEIGLADQLEQVADTGRQARLVFRQARAVGGQACHRIAGQRRHAFLVGAGAQQLGELLQVLVDHGHVFVEVHQDPEHLLEVRIVVLQRVVQLARADDHQLDVERDHLRRQADGGDPAQLAQRRLHLQLARLQGTLERIPHKRLAKHLLGFEDQEAAIGTVQRTRAKLAVRGVQRALVGAVFDTAEQVVVGRVRLEYHRCPTVGVVADHQARRVLFFEQLARHGIGLAVVDQLLDQGAQQVQLHGLQVGANRRVLGVLFRQRRQQRLQGQGDGLFVELAQLVVRLALPLRQAGELLVQAFLEQGDVSWNCSRTSSGSWANSASSSALPSAIGVKATLLASRYRATSFSSEARSITSRARS